MHQLSMSSFSFELEMSTRLSKECCVAFAEHGASVMIYSLIRSCNRSEPHVELVVTALSILINLSRHESTLYSLIEPKEAIEVLLETCQNFRDKQRVFKLGITLLESIWCKMRLLIVRRKCICLFNSMQYMLIYPLL
jgi:hypothetical protein